MLESWNYCTNKNTNVGLEPLTSGSRGGGEGGGTRRPPPNPNGRGPMIFFLHRTLIFSTLAINFEHNFNRNMTATRLNLLQLLQPSTLLMIYPPPVDKVHAPTPLRSNPGSATASSLSLEI